MTIHRYLHTQAKTYSIDLGYVKTIFQIYTLKASTIKVYCENIFFISKIFIFVKWHYLILDIISAFYGKSSRNVLETSNKLKTLTSINIYTFNTIEASSYLLVDFTNFLFFFITSRRATSKFNYKATYLSLCKNINDIATALCLLQKFTLAGDNYKGHIQTK